MMMATRKAYHFKLILDDGPGGKTWEIFTPDQKTWIARVKAVGDYDLGDPHKVYGLESPKYNMKRFGQLDNTTVELVWEHLNQALIELADEAVNE
jgi:hypothetical protein